MSKSLKIHLTSSPEKAASVFKELVSSYYADKPVRKSLFTDDELLKKNQILLSSSDNEDKKEESHVDEVDDGMKKLDDVATESSIITTETSNASPTT